MSAQGSLRAEAFSAFSVEAIFREVTEGLSATPKRLPEKLLYDRRGTRLFEQICRLEAYYPTRTEIGILRDCLPEVRALAGPGARVVEFGTGSGTKTSMLLGAMDSPAACGLIDIAEPQLSSSADRLRMAHPGVTVVPVAADYTRPFTLPGAVTTVGGGRLLLFFPGSTIGNFDPDEAARFLGGIGSMGGRGALLLIGVDLVKARETLERAYDDPQGVTAEFNLNALRHLNRVLGADFAIGHYRHRALWNEGRSRVEMRLVSEANQIVTLRPRLEGADPVQVSIARGEEIVTEHSYKYRRSEFAATCSAVGWTTLRSWTDPKEWFLVQLLRWEGSNRG